MYKGHPERGEQDPPGSPAEPPASSVPLVGMLAARGTHTFPSLVAFGLINFPSSRSSADMTALTLQRSSAEGRRHFGEEGEKSHSQREQGNNTSILTYGPSPPSWSSGVGRLSMAIPKWVNGGTGRRSALT